MKILIAEDDAVRRRALRSQRLILLVRALALIALAGGVSRDAFAYPTCLNIMPTADVMGIGTARIELESDGDPTPFSDGAEVVLFTQVGLTDRLEVGADVVGLNTGGDIRANAKWQMVPGSKGAPAVAVGLLDMTQSGVLSDWYIVLSRDVGHVRAHAGFVQDDADRGMFGAEYWPTARTGLLTDWATGPQAYLTLGVCHDMGGGVGGLLYYAHNNSRYAGDFVGLNFCWQGAWGRL